MRQLEIKVLNITDARCNHEVYLDVLFSRLSDWAASLENGVKFETGPRNLLLALMQIGSVVYPLSCLRDAEAMQPESEKSRQNSCNISNYFQ